MLEFYHHPSVAQPDYRAIDPLVLHIAFRTADVTATRDRLMAAGAVPVGEVRRTEAGDELAMLRDPLGTGDSTRAAPGADDSLGSGPRLRVGLAALGLTCGGEVWEGMAKVDVVVEVEIAANPADMAAVMFDPAREKDWMDAVTRVELSIPRWRRARACDTMAVFSAGRSPGSRRSRPCTFRTCSACASARGRSWAPSVTRSNDRRAGSRAVCRNVGEPGSLGFPADGAVEGPMRSAMAGDLARLKALVEG